MLTRVRNAINARHMKVPMPLSNMKVRVAEVLKGEGFIEGYEVEKSTTPPTLTIQLRYDENRDPVITGIKRISRPGLRQYVKSDAIPMIRNGLGVAIVSTSRGVMTDREARRQGLGGELVCTVW
jgi:small subunit ribosomal protein S8